VSSIEAQPIMEGRAMIMLLTPGAKKPAKGAGLKPERSEPQPTGGTA
jgi:hypothetical protein